MKKSILSTISIFFIFISTVKANEWEWLNPKPYGDGSYEISFPTKNVGYGVGMCKTITKTVDGGLTWKILFVTNDISILSSIFFTDESHGFVTSYNGYIYKTMDGGKQWRKIFVDKIKLNRIYFPSNNIGYITSIEGKIFKTEDAGETWSLQNTGSTDELTYIQFMDNNNGFVTSGIGTMLQTKDGGKTWLNKKNIYSRYSKISFPTLDTGYILATPTKILKTYDRGTTWSEFAVPNYCYDIKFVNTKLGYAACSEGSIYKTLDEGVSWTKIYSHDVLANGLSLNLYAIDEENVFIYFENGLFLKLMFDGKNWSPYSKSKTSSFTSVFKTENNIFLGVSTSRTGIYKSTDFGYTWNLINNQNINKKYFSKVFFINQKIGFAITDSEMFKTSDEGNNWTPIQLPINTSIGENLSDFKFSNLSDGIFITRNGAVFQSIDTGNTWLKLSYNTQNYLSSISMLDEKTGIIVGSDGSIFKTNNGFKTWQKMTNSSNKFLRYVNYIDENTWFAVGFEGEILKSTDGGNTWLKKQSGVKENLSCIKFVTKQLGYCVGDNGVMIKTQDGGESWELINSSTLKGLFDLVIVDSNNVLAFGSEGVFNNSSFEILSKNNRINELNDIKMFNAKNGIAVGNGQILITNNGGLDWNLSVLSIKNNIYSLELIDSVTAIGADEYGNVFKTSDRGKSWKTIPINNNTEALIDIYVLNKNNCFILSSKGNVYKSTDSGENWNKIASNNLFSGSNSIYFINNNVGIISGTGIYKTIDGGINWENVTGYNYNNKNYIYFIDSINGFSGQYRTTDGGNTWKEFNFKFVNANELHFVNDTLGYAAFNAGYVYKTINRGETWELDTTTITCKNLKSIHSANIEEVFVCGDEGAILKFSTGLKNKVDTTTVTDTTKNTANLNELKNIESWKVYPNPANSSITIQFDELNQSQFLVEIYDMYGNLIKNEILKNKINYIPIAELSCGVYFIQFISDEKRELKKIVVNR
jgi:photosystem II stability/assembly factor-like uncharacterized protein